MRYRADIDGLRAIAVGSVVLYHADSHWLPGGFTGVDVFFVISGYLITRLIVEDVAQGRFSLCRFYERRARRILPALVVVLLAATLAAIAWLPPADLQQFGRSLAATAVFGSNLFFWKNTGYFDAPAEAAPLLHTWSLAVEEQYYLLFPPLLVLLLTRDRRWLAPVMLGAMGASLAVAEWGALHHPWAAFFLGPTRAWELLCGAVLALGLVPRIAGRAVGEVLGWTGLASMLAGFILVSGDSRFPGLLALLPCLGAALVIHSAESQATWLSRLLSLRVLVFVGLISYSLYLWHWVLFVYARHLAFRELVLGEKLGLIGLSVVVAVVSWRFVEQPLRRISRGAASTTYPRPVLAAAAAASIAVVGAGIALHALDGLPGRFSPAALAYADGEHSYWPRRDECDGRMCDLAANTAGRPAVLVWGDSHAAAIAPALQELADATGKRALLAYKKVCAPLVGFRDYAADPYCDDFIAEVLEFVEREGVERVILHARWAWYVEGSRNEEERARHLQLAPDAAGPEANGRAFARMLTETVDRLNAMGATVEILTSVPEVGVSAPRLLARHVQRGDRLPTIARETFERRQARAHALIEGAATSTAARVVHLHPFLCDDRGCSIARNGRVLYHDDDHLSLEGAREIRQALGRSFVGVETDVGQLR